MDFKWQHTEWLYAAPLLLLAIVISAVLFNVGVKMLGKFWELMTAPSAP